MASNATHYNNLTPAQPLDKATLNKMVLRSLNLQASFNYERMQAAGWLYCILPGLEKIHADNKEDLELSMEHNLEFFNTHPFLVTFVMGIILSLEQQKADIGMAGLTVTEERAKQVDFSDPYYNAAQKIICKADDKTFDNCKTKEDVDKILQGFDKSVLIGGQNGTTGQYYVEGSNDFGFKKLNATWKGYANGSLAVQDLINGGINYVIIDAAPATAITNAINAVA